MIPALEYATQSHKRPAVVAGSTSARTIAGLEQELRCFAAHRPWIGNPWAHLVFSPAPGDMPLLFQDARRAEGSRVFRDVMTRVMAQMGYGQGLWAAIAHHDGAQWHVSVVASRIDATGAVIASNWSGRSARLILSELERDLGLRRTGTARLDRAPTRDERERDQRLGVAPEAMLRTRILSALERAHATGGTLSAFAYALRAEGVSTRYWPARRDLPIQGISYAISEAGQTIARQGSRLGRGYTWPGLQRHRGLSFDPTRDRRGVLLDPPAPALAKAAPGGPGPQSAPAPAVEQPHPTPAVPSWLADGTPTRLPLEDLTPVRSAAPSSPPPRPEAPQAVPEPPAEPARVSDLAHRTTAEPIDAPAPSPLPPTDSPARGTAVEPPSLYRAHESPEPLSAPEPLVELPQAVLGTTAPVEPAPEHGSADPDDALAASITADLDALAQAKALLSNRHTLDAEAERSQTALTQAQDHFSAWRRALSRALEPLSTEPRHVIARLEHLLERDGESIAPARLLQQMRRDPNIFGSMPRVPGFLGTRALTPEEIDQRITGIRREVAGYAEAWQTLRRAEGSARRAEQAADRLSGGPVVTADTLAALRRRLRDDLRRLPRSHRAWRSWVVTHAGLIRSLLPEAPPSPGLGR